MLLEVLQHHFSKDRKQQSKKIEYIFFYHLGTNKG